MIKFLSLISAFAILFPLSGKSIAKSVKWKSLKWHSGFKVLNKNTPADPQTRFKISSDRNFIYFMVEAFEPAMDKLVTRKQAFADDFSIWSNDGIEIGISNDKSYQKYCKIAIDHSGQHADSFAQDDNTGRNEMTYDQSFESNVKVETAKTPSSYIIYAAIPFGAFDFSSNELADKWKFNIARVRRASLPKGKMEFTSYSNLKGSGFAEPWSFAPLPLKKNRPQKICMGCKQYQICKKCKKQKKLQYQLHSLQQNRCFQTRVIQSVSEKPQIRV